MNDNTITKKEIINIIKKAREKVNKEINKDYIDEFYKDGVNNGIGYILEIIIESEIKNMNYKQTIEYIKKCKYWE